jgi:tetratricopeptide (TPR) repeat protein
MGWTYFDGFGNRIAARGWFNRAMRLLEGEGPCIERGWVLVGMIGCSVANAAELEAHATEALAIARRFGERDLEAKALADGGLAFVSQGRVADGMSWLDEAMALAVGGAVSSPVTASFVACALFTACDRSCDLARAEGWIRVLEQQRVLGDGGSPPMNAHCASQYGSLLAQIGRWSEAEPALTRAVEVAEELGYGLRVVTRAPLAELRIRQGRLDDAERLLLGYEDRAETALPWARLHLARGDHDLAAAAARRGARLLGADRSRAAPLLVVLVEAELGRGALDAARAVADELDAMAADRELAALAAQAEFVKARVAAASGDVDAVISHCEAGLATLAGADLPLLRAELHLELARAQAQRDRRTAALEARAALAIYDRLGAPPAASEYSLFHELGVIASPGALPVASLRRSSGAWTLTADAATFHLRHSKGLAYLADLLAHPGVERHVLDLVDLVEGTPDEPGLDRRGLGDAGELLDATAKAAYRRRLSELREDLDDALVVGNEATAERLQAEIDAVVAELARAVGLGGRDRRAAAVCERARLNVTRALRTAIQRIQELAPPIGAHLDRSVRTGVYCSYVPASAEGVLELTAS